MANQNDGGPAFPRPQMMVHGNPMEQQTTMGQSNDGMTLRDYFAGQAAIPILEGIHKSTPESIEHAAKTEKFDGNRRDFVSFLAYRHADSMLAERDRKDDDHE